MPEPFIGELRVFGFGFPPRQWAACDGQILPIKSNQALFSLIGAAFGGDGTTNFALPDLRGRMPIGIDGRSPSLGMGASGGDEAVMLTEETMARHGHGMRASTSPGDQIISINNAFAAVENGYNPAPTTLTRMQGFAVEEGQGGGHPNMQPFLTLQICIALQGLYPSRN
ncbi:MAG: tail fiber protein [Pseudomonadota bacterium]